MNKNTIILIAVVGLIELAAFWGIGKYNGLVTKDESVSGQWANVENQYQRRADLIPNLVETVKGYAKHEKETLENVIKARNMAISASNTNDKIKAEGEVSGMLSRLFALAESYPDLKANTNFQDLMAQLKAIEEDIANARKYYNGVVRNYNTDIEVFPANLIANMFKFSKKPLFEVEEESQRKNVKVEF